MGQTTLTELSQPKFPPLLLCLPGETDAAARLLAVHHRGKSLLFHQIMHYRSVGADQIMLSVEAVSGSLLALIDELGGRGIHVDIVRSPNEILTKSAPASTCLVAQAEIWFESEIICQVAAAESPLLATVEEHTENGAFERIDLNNRWAGMALLDFDIFKTTSDLPEDWDLGSSLLRQTLQRNPKMLRIRQSDVMALKITHLIKHDDYSQFFNNSFVPKGFLEGRFFKTVSSRVAKFAWHSPAALNVANWSFSLFSFFSLTMAFLVQPVAASLLAIIAIAFADFRRFVRVSEYRTHFFDLVQLASWAAVVLTLGVSLFNIFRETFEALYLTSACAALQLISNRVQPKGWISPLSSALVLFTGAFFGVLPIVCKILILGQIGNLLYFVRDKSVQS
jgi:hypothetical protein